MIEYRTSTYNIYIDLVEKKDHILIIHGYTGEFLLARKELAAFLKNSQHFIVGDNVLKSGESAYQLSGDEITALKVKGIITSKPASVEQDFFLQLVGNRHQRFKIKPIEYVFLLTYSCNFNCDYCFQNSMKVQLGSEKSGKQITKDLVDRIIQAVPVIEQEKNTYRPEDVPREVIFYGGEPLLKKNKSIVEYIMSEFNKTGKVKYYAISNGYELDCYTNLMGKNKISSIQVTLDGFADSHDIRRNVAEENESSFQKICDNISKALDENININLRLNFDETNIDSLLYLMPEVEKRGWNDKELFSISVSPVYLLKSDENVNTTYNLSSLFDVIRAARENNAHCGKLKFDEEKYLEKLSLCFDGEKGISDYFHTTYCSGPTNMLVFDPFANVYGCLEKGAEPESAIGKINGNGSFVFNDSYQEYWESRIVTSNKTCAQCAYALFCGGGCATKAEERNGTIFSNYCNGFKEFFNRKVAEVFENKEKYVELSKYI